MDPSKKRKAFGQHFLVDKKVIGAIADKSLELFEKNTCRELLEIGPGRGAITEPLLAGLAARNAKDRFRVIEKDRELAAIWQGQGVRTTRADFLDLGDGWMSDGQITDAEAGRLAVGGPIPIVDSHAKLGVVSNLPYSAGTAIFTTIAEHPGQVAFMVLMFQAEVARRIRAHPGERAFGSLSLWSQNHWDVNLLIKAPPGAFRPPPQVDSEVIVLTPRATPRVPGTETPEGAERWQNLIKVAFLHKRKMLRSSLPQGLYQNALGRAGLDGTKRAEALDWSEWIRLFEQLSASSA